MLASYSLSIRKDEIRKWKQIRLCTLTLLVHTQWVACHLLHTRSHIRQGRYEQRRQAESKPCYSTVQGQRWLSGQTNCETKITYKTGKRWWWKSAQKCQTIVNIKPIKEIRQWILKGMRKGAFTDSVIGLFLTASFTVDGSHKSNLICFLAENFSQLLSHMTPYPNFIRKSRFY